MTRNSREPHLTVDQRGAHAEGDIVGRDKIVHIADPALADEKIDEQLSLLRRKRLFSEFDRIREARRLGEACLTGMLSGGSNLSRSSALAWCARILSSVEPLADAEKLLEQGRSLGSSYDLAIAEAFILSKKEGKVPALQALGKIDTPAAKTASLFVVTQHASKADALLWLKQSGLEPRALDSDGKNLLLGIQLEQADWKGAETTASVCDDQECAETPLLWLNRAFQELLKIVPEEYRQIVHGQLPFEMGTIDLASTSEALSSHKRAHLLFAKSAKVFSDLGLQRTSEIAEEYALWLALRHPELKEGAKTQLREALAVTGKAIRYVPFALSFSIPLDIPAVEAEIDRRVALSGASTMETAVARLALSLTQTSRAEVARYIARHRAELTPHIDPRALAFIEIEMLAKSGQADEAKRRVEELIEQVHLNESEKSRLDVLLSEATTDDPISARRVRYEESGLLIDLRGLVDALEGAKDWQQLAVYAAQLFPKTQSVEAAEQLVAALVKTGQDQEALSFLGEHKSFIDLSVKLRSLHCWALYRAGRVQDAKLAHSRMVRDEDKENFDALRRNLSVASGDWNELSRIVADAASDLQNRDPKALLQAAYLGFQINSPAAKELLFAAARRSADDANLLASSYFLATNAGLEESEEVAGWLHRAAALSGDKGPIFHTSLQEIIEKQPEWNKREQETRKLLRSGELPLFMAAQSLNVSLIECTLTPFLHNQKENDPRRRVAVPAYSGKRQRQSHALPKVLGLDATALLTLGALGKLDLLERGPSKIVVPHSTLEWLFVDRQRASFHQPSRFRDAAALRAMLTDGALSVFAPEGMPDSKLAQEIGDDLAGMIQHAKVLPAGGRSAHYVVRSAPVPKLSTLLQEQANLDGHASILVSCQAVVRKLATMGRISESQQKRALSYLTLNEQPWASEPEIQEGATLLLDGLSVSYLQHCGVLGMLKDVGFEVKIPPSAADESRSLLSYQGLTVQVDNVVESIRKYLHDGIVSGKVTLSPTKNLDDDDEQSSAKRHPTFEAVGLGELCDVVVIDDRFLNQHQNIELKNGSLCPLATSVELLSSFAASGYITEEMLKEARYALRTGGYLMLDVDGDEVLHELAKSSVKDGAIQESAELRALRESIALARLTGTFRSSDETAWLDRTILGLISAYRRLWQMDVPMKEIYAKAHWLLPLMDVRGWLHLFPEEQALHILHVGRANQVALLLFAPSDINDERREQFFRWVDEEIVRPIKQQDEELFRHLVELMKGRILSYLDRDLLNEVTDEN